MTYRQAMAFRDAELASMRAAACEVSARQDDALGNVTWAADWRRRGGEWNAKAAALFAQSQK